MKLHRILLVIVAMMWMQSALAANAAIGRQLAQTRCAPCHTVESIERGDVLADSPSFNAIGRKFGFDTVLLVNAVLDPHPRMNMAITRREAEDLAAYIATLAR